MINFLHTFNPSPILWSYGPINIYWYGSFIVLGIIAALLLTIKLASYYKIEKGKVIDLAFWIILAGIIGARIYHVLFELPYYLKHFLDILKIWQGGLAIHGAIIAGLIVIWFFAKYSIGRLGLSEGGRASTARRFWLLASLIAPGLALAQAIGRWGNYFNQELFGKPTDSPWGIPINPLNRPIEYFSQGYFHPTFLYESLGDLVIFITLITLHYFIIKKVKATNKFSIFNFQFSIFIYLILYSLLRFFLEFIRLDRTPILLDLRWPQIASLIIIIASIIILLKNVKKHDSIKNSSH